MDQNRCEIGGVVYLAKPVRLGRCHGFDGCIGCAAHGIDRASLDLCKRLPHCLAGRRADRRDVVWKMGPNHDHRRTQGGSTNISPRQ